MPITNGDLLQAKKSRWRDKLFIVAREPIYHKDKGIYELVIHETDPAAVLDSLYSRYPEQPTVGNLRNQGSTENVRWKDEWEDLWLLSGGTLVFNEQEQIALGQQDDTAVYPYLWTNIGAGLCDHDLKDHCFEELESEFILFVFFEVDEDQAPLSKRVCFRTQEETENIEPKPVGPQKLYTLEAKPFDNFIKNELDRIHSVTNSIFQEYIYLAPSTKPVRDGKLSTMRKNLEITLKGPSGWEWDITKKGPYDGYTWKNEDNHTVEFRLHLQFDLASFPKHEIFFGEGTGNAMWKSLNEIDELIEANFNKGRVTLLTPFMTNFLKEYKDAEEFDNLLQLELKDEVIDNTKEAEEFDNLLEPKLKDEVVENTKEAEEFDNPLQPEVKDEVVENIFENSGSFFQ